MSLFNYALAAIPIVGLVYLFLSCWKDLLFYKNNHFDYSKKSGVPEFWVRLGPRKFVLSPKQRLLLGYPVFSMILIALMVLFFIAK
jgi:hypothetical protein